MEKISNYTHSVVSPDETALTVQFKAEKNPSIDEEFKEQFAIIPKKELVQTLTDIVEGGIGSYADVGVMTQVILDKQPYWKSYHSAFEVQMKLTYGALKLYLYIGNHLRPGDDTIDLGDVAKIMGVFGWKSPTMYYRGIKELIKQEVLFKKEHGGQYWVNLKMFFNGSRIKKTRTFIKAHEPVVINGKKVARYERVTESIEIEENNDEIK